jgi:ankyrin repeat protein
MNNKSKKVAETVLGAVEAGDLERLRELIAQGADVDESNEMTALSKAAELGSVPMVQALLEAGADVNFGGLSVPLCGAAYKGHAEIVRLLLDAGAEVDRAEDEGITALMAAAGGGHLEVVKMLIAAGADLKATDSDGESALIKGRGHPEIVAFLKPLSSPKDVEYLEAQAKEPDRRADELFKEVEGGDLAAVDDLLKSGVVVDVKDPYGRTPLRVAADRAQAAIAERLLAAGADVNAPDEIEGKTPFLAAIGRNEAARNMMRLLARHDADIRATDRYGRSALALADRDLGRNDEDSAELRALLTELGLLSAGAEQLAAAAAKGDLDTVRRLTEAGTPLDSADEQERTPLYMAVSRRQPEIVAYLLKSGADPNKPIGSDDGADTQWGGFAVPCPKCKTSFVAIVNPRHCPQCGARFDSRRIMTGPRPDLPLHVSWHNEFTPLMAAAKLGDVKIARMLVEARANIDLGKGQITPLMCACHFGHLELVRLLIEKGAGCCVDV